MAEERPVYRGSLPEERVFEGVPIVGGLEALASSFIPIKREVIREPEVQYYEDMGRRYVDKVIPGEYGEPRLGTPAAIQGILDFVGFLKDDPGEAAAAIGSGIASIPETQMQGALALMQGADYAYDPGTGETSTFDPLLLPATTALGTAASIARVADDGSTVLGIMGGRGATSGAKKEKKFDKAKSGSFFRYPADDREAFDRTKGYIEPSDGQFRFEIDTSNAKLSKAWTKSKRTVTGEGTEDNPEFYYNIDFQARMRKGKAFDTPTLGELIDFPELFKEYPDLAKMPVRQLPPRDVARGVGAAYDGETDEIYIGAGSRKTLMSNILHEIQHAIQKREGFTRGTSPASYLPDNHYENLDVLRKSTRSEAQDLGKKFNMGPYKLVQAAKAFRQFGPGLDDGSPEMAKVLRGSAYFDFSKVADADDLKRLSRLVDDNETLMEMESAVVEANKLYRRQPGEVEARTVQKKFVENRQGEFPLDVQDTPPEEYVFNLESQANLGPQASRLTDLDTFADYLGGTVLPADTTRKVFFKDLDFSNVTIEDSREVPGAINIQLLHAAKKGKGSGSEIMNRITQLADDTSKVLTLYPSPYPAGEGGLGLEDLVEFYQRKGFQFQDPDPDRPDLDRLMIRYPRKAEGGVVSMVDVARDMTRGPRGVESLVPVARNMNRSMLG